MIPGSFFGVIIFAVETKTSGFSYKNHRELYFWYVIPVYVCLSFKSNLRIWVDKMKSKFKWYKINAKVCPFFSKISKSSGSTCIYHCCACWVLQHWGLPIFSIDSFYSAAAFQYSWRCSLNQEKKRLSCDLNFPSLSKQCSKDCNLLKILSEARIGKLLICRYFHQS